MYLIIAIPLTIITIMILLSSKNKYLFAPYLFYLICPILTYFGYIGVLTGFNVQDSGVYAFGLSFYTVNIAYLLEKKILPKNKVKFLLAIINPLYLFTGPLPLNANIKTLKLRRLKRIIIILNAELIMGIFFATVLAPTLTAYFYLKNSTNIIDIIIFGIIFELYVYFNFAGFSMIAWVLMRIIGVKAPRNFNQPFSATSIIDYWQKWHISLAKVLKELFYVKLKNSLGVHGSVLVVFIMSALWHGISINFIIWGLFHSIIWSITYYLNKNGFKLLNYPLMIIGIILGRIIFSESDYQFLLDKLSNICNVGKWSGDYEFYFLKSSMRENINMIIIFTLIIMEVILPRIGIKYINYNYLKNSKVSTLVFMYLCLTFTGFEGEPIYGNR